MREMLFDKKIGKFIGTLYFINLFFYLLFGRPYSGIYIANFRMGELIIGFFLITNLVILFSPVKFLKTNVDYDNRIIYIYKLIILSFFCYLVAK